MSRGEWDLVIDTNLKGCFLCTQAAARHMRSHARRRDREPRFGCNKWRSLILVAYHGEQGWHLNVHEGRRR